MKRLALAGLALLIAAACLTAQRRSFGARDVTLAPPLANSPEEKRILAVLDQAASSGNVYLEVPPVDGRMLRLLTETANAKHVVEIGTSTGYSGLWLTLALQKTGGTLTTFEVDKDRAAQARKHFEAAGVSGLVRIIEGDAHQNVRQLKGPIDVAFIDADKEGYVDYLNTLLPLIRPGGLILAHNINTAPDYIKAVSDNPALETVHYMHGGGLSITIRKR